MENKHRYFTVQPIQKHNIAIIGYQTSITSYLTIIIKIPSALIFIDSKFENALKL